MTDKPLTPLAPNVTPIIMHIEHTGGTTLQRIIERQYKAEETYLVYKPALNPTPVFMAKSEDERRRYKLVFGHLYYGIHRYVPGESRYLTILRHPVDRMISSYTYIARKETVPKHNLYKTNAITWAQHFDRRQDWMRQMNRIVGGDDTVLENWLRKTLPDNALEIALNHLENDFAMVGLQDRYDESLLMMRHVLNWTKPIVYVRQNVTTKRVTLSDLKADDRALIEKMAEFEMPLYEYAKKRFAAQIEAYPGDIERDLAQFRNDNARYTVTMGRINRIKAPFRTLKRTLKRVLKPSSA